MSASAEMSKANFITEGNNFFNILEKGAAAGNMVAKDTIVGLKDFMNERTSIYKNQYYFKPTNTNDEWWFDIVISGFQSQSDMVITVHYTHLTLPTNRKVYNTVDDVLIKK